MTITKIKNDEHWHRLRSSHIGASEVASLLIGHDELELYSDDTFLTAHELYCLKRGLLKGRESSKVMEFGNVMEPIIAHMIATENDFEIGKAHDYHEHPDYPFLGCTLDYYVFQSPEGPVLLQIKNVVHTSYKWTQAKAPPAVEIQVQQELMVVNAARKAAGLEPFAAHCIGSMHKGNPEDIRIMYRPALPEVQEAIIDAGKRFWCNMNAGIEPAIDNPKDYKHILQMIKAAEKIEKTIDLRGNKTVDKLAMEYLEAKQARLMAEKREDMLKARLMRHCMAEEKGSMVAYIYAKSDNCTLSLKEIQVQYKAKPASIGKQTRFDVNLSKSG